MVDPQHANKKPRKRLSALRIKWMRWRIQHSPNALRTALDEVRDLWKRALEREGDLAAAVADVMWKATPFGTTEDGDIYAYIVPKGCMHRLIGVAQQNGAHVSVAFRAVLDEQPTGPENKEDV